jgi:hypothetical protein
MKKVLSLLFVGLLLIALTASTVSAGIIDPGKMPIPGGKIPIPKITPTPVPFPKIPTKPIDDPGKKIPIDPGKLPKITPTPTPFPKIPIKPIDDPGKKTPIDPGKIPKVPKITPTPTAPLPKMPIKPIDPPGGKFPIDPGKAPTFPLPKDPADPQTPITPGTPKTKVPDAGNFVTSEGPLFIMFRDDLTEGYEMFTPMDLSLDGEYVFPLVSNAMHTVGEVKVTVKKGLVTAHPQMFLGVKLTDGILTFFADFRAVQTIKPKELKSVDIPFDLPVSIANRLGVDDKVLMYINCPVSYQSGAASIHPFSLEDPAYLERMYALIDLMD